LAEVEGVIPPFEAAYGTHVYHQYTIRVTEGRRDQLKDHLAARGIGTMIYYPIPVHKLKIYEEVRVGVPAAENASSEALSLPIGPVVGKTVQDRVVRAMREGTWRN
ncbi:MAG: erythromycin biosynthesis sensory transduction protein eryC1, partial [Gammaproteobacteria bacterium]|nr:erythromycin biosynthesis sensory transduction protein eryC1 [Gammaproteobacteria bacterium]